MVMSTLFAVVAKLGFYVVLVTKFSVSVDYVTPPLGLLVFIDLVVACYHIYCVVYLVGYVIEKKVKAKAQEMRDDANNAIHKVTGTNINLPSGRQALAMQAVAEEAADRIKPMLQQQQIPLMPQQQQPIAFIPQQNPGYPPANAGYPPPNPGYPPQNPGYPPPNPNPAYPQQGFSGYPPENPGYPTQQPPQV